jgi:hypothetical protein
LREFLALGYEFFYEKRLAAGKMQKAQTTQRKDTEE